MKARLVLGIMSGTSIDGVDYAVCLVSHERVSLKRHWQVKFPARLRARLHRAASDQSSGYELAQLHHDLGRFYAEQAGQGLKNLKPRLAGLHGQTVYHHPHSERPATLQLGEPAYLAETLRIPVVHNFRAADLAAGGHGAPLATLFHKVVFGRTGLHVCVNNLGGISNVTSIDWTRGRHPAMLAFDTGPANMLLDMAIRHLTKDKRSHDRNGSWAASGTISEPLLARWLTHEYFQRPPPKSTGRELFGEPFFQRVLRDVRKVGLSGQDLLATLTELSARSLVLNYQLHLGAIPDQVVLAGGGAANPTLVNRIEKNLRAWNDNLEVLTSEALGWPVQSIEAAAFALLACYRWERRPGNIPQTTGAHRAALLGCIAEP